MKPFAYNFLSEPREESKQQISMSVDHFRWLLMWRGAFVRELMAVEIRRDGLDEAVRRTRLLDRRRRAFLKHKKDDRRQKQVDPASRSASRCLILAACALPDTSST